MKTKNQYNEKEKLRINLEIDYEVNPKIYALLEKVNKRKRAGLLRRVIEDNLK